MEKIKANLIEHVKSNFPEATAHDHAGNRLDFNVNKQCIPSVLTYFKDMLGYIHLSHISCVDWLEEGEFEMIILFGLLKKK